MNLLQHPELLERLAASYALGTLRGGARRRFEAMAREQAPVRAAALVWQTRLSAVAELQQPVAPSAAVWTRIDNLVRADREDRAMQAARLAPAAPAGPSAVPAGGWWRNVQLWRGATLASAAVALLLSVQMRNVGEQQAAKQAERHAIEVAALRAQLASTPQIQYVAVLADDRATASILATYDPKAGRLTLQRVGDYREGDDKSLQLWALPPGAAPRSLGVLGADRVLRLDATQDQVNAVPALAISLEPKGGVPSATGPTGPVLFKGALLSTAI